jgi:hypothetical protein
MRAHRHLVGSSIGTALAVGCGLWMAASTDAHAQQNPAQTAPAQQGVFLNLPEPYAGLDCGAAYRPDWKLSLDQIVGYAESQVSACDLAVTLSTIDGDVSRAYAKIGLANTQNWVAWSAAAAFLPGPDDPAAEDQTSRVRTAQASIQNARDGLRFLAKLSAVMQYPPAQSADIGFDTAPKQTAPALPQNDDSAAIQRTPLAPPTSGQNPVDQSPFAAAPTQQAQAPVASPSPPARLQVACVTSTAWVLQPRPAQNRGRMTIDDPVAGQALVWLSGYRPAAASGAGIHAFAACPGATIAFSPSTYTALPGAAQGLTPSPGPASPDTSGAPPPAPSPIPPQGVPPSQQQD